MISILTFIGKYWFFILAVLVLAWFLSPSTSFSQKEKAVLEEQLKVKDALISLLKEENVKLK